MTGVSDGQGQLFCSDARLLLEKKILEDVLSVEEQASLDKHTAECARCRNVEQLILVLPMLADNASNDSVDTGVNAVIAGLRRVREARRRNVRWAAAAGAVAATVIFSLAIVLRPSVEAPSVQISSVSCAPSIPRELAPGVFMTHCGEEAPAAVLEDGRVRVVLEHGAVALFVDPARPAKKSVIVETPLGEVRVKGTLFSVRVEQEDARVDVYRGIVEVVPKEIEQAYDVPAGRGTALRKRTTFACAARADNSLLRPLPFHSNDKATEEIQTGASKSSLESLEKGDDAGAVGEDTSQKDAVGPARKDRRAAVDAAGRSVAAMDALIQEARSCLLNRNWDCAASRYREVVKSYSRHPESAAVLISLGKIELRHLNQPDKALARFRSYLQTLPNGPLAEEALIGKAEAYRRLGMEAKERDTLRTFLDRFPDSSLSGKARGRLSQI